MLQRAGGAFPDLVKEVLQEHAQGSPTAATEYAIQALAEYGGDVRQLQQVRAAALTLSAEVDRPEFRKEWAYYAGMLACIGIAARADEEAERASKAWEDLHPVKRVVGQALPVLQAIADRPLGRSFLSELADDKSLGLSKSGIREHLVKLQKLGCISTSGSNRAQSMALTPLGRRLVDEAGGTEIHRPESPAQVSYWGYDTGPSWGKSWGTRQGTVLASIVSRIVDEGYNKGDLTVLDELVDDKAAWLGPQTSPYPTKVSVRAAMKESIRDTRSVWPGARWVADLIEEGDKVACRLSMQGGPQEQAGAIALSGQQSIWFRIAEGKVVEAETWMRSELPQNPFGQSSQVSSPKDVSAVYQPWRLG